MLDANFFPHLVEGILDAAPHETLLSFRASCKEYKQRADTKLFTRVCLLPRAEPSSWGMLSGSLCTVPTPSASSSPSPYASGSSTPAESSADLLSTATSVPKANSYNSRRSVSSASSEDAPSLSSSPLPSPPGSRVSTPPPPTYVRLPLGPISSPFDTLALTRVLDLPRDDTPVGDALLPLLWRLEQIRPKLEIVRNAGSRVPRCILPRTHTFVDFSVPWNTYLFRLGPSMFPPSTERAVLHGGETMHPAARVEGLGVVLGALTRSELPRSVKEAVVVVGGCSANPDALVEYGQALYLLAQRAALGACFLEVVGLERVLQLPEVDEEGRDVCAQITRAVAPYIAGSTRAEVEATLGHITFTDMASWIARSDAAAKLESRFDL